MANFTHENGNPEFQIAPMVNVVFVLLLFVVVSAGVQLVEKELSIELPTCCGSAASSIVVIAIASDGQVTLNDQVFGESTDRELVRLETWLSELTAENGDQDLVIIRPADETRHQRVVDVLNACAFGRVKNLTFS